MLFKGGTSLSKPSAGSKQRKRLLEKLGTVTREYVRNDLHDRLTTNFSGVLNDKDWSIDIDKRDPETINFTYPPSLGARGYGGVTYLNPIVRLEFGARGEQWPAHVQTLTPYVADRFPDLFSDPTVSVRTLDVERTFWEKAIILHREFHRENIAATGDRISRHYYDLHMLARSSVRTDALDNRSLLTAVAEHNKIFFRASWANYDGAKPGSLRLLPHDELERTLRSDYSKMQEMIFGNPPDFDTVLTTLRDLESEINDSA